jgi:SAM-dependent methyltransferase
MSASHHLRETFAATEELNRTVILGLVPRVAGGTLLDLGCGDGAFTERLADRAGAGLTIGVELDVGQADRAAQRGIEVRRGDLSEPIPVDDRSVDLVHANQVIEHLAGTDHFMREICRVMRPDGYAIVSTNNLASLHNILSLLMGWQPPAAHVSDERVGLGNPMAPFGRDEGAPGQMHLRLFTATALRQLAAMHGLRADRVRAAGFYPLRGRPAAIAARALPRMGAFLVQRFRPA